MKTLGLLFLAFFTLYAHPTAAQTPTGKIMNEDRLREMIKDKLAPGHLEFIERRDDDSLTVYEYYLMQGDTLRKFIVNARTGVLDTVFVETQQGRAFLQARQIAQTRAETAALAAVAGEIIRWKLKKSEGAWLYKFRVATHNGKFKDVFVAKENFEVQRIRNHEQPLVEH